MVVLVSGGTSTLGSAICRHFVARGDRVLCGYHSAVERARLLREELGNQLIPLPLDLQDPAMIEEQVKGIEHLDALVNNSGIFTEATIEELPLSEWREVFSVNVEGLFLLSRACIPLLKASHGSIVNIASINALHPGFGRTAHYDASKGAVVAFTRSLAAELAPHVRVNGVAPGLLETPSLDMEHPLRRRYEKRALLASLVDPGEVAKVVALLCDCRAMSGETIVVDGGYLVG